ncbi:RnfH family protein [Photobacterium halotolerans]|uniref:RnfH family protein n=1 Tax=Photobacterium halotolerans TaxID=265726 RepID=UPI00137299B3|nr:RnfH family protein [Photobacterium halotolerans]NAX47771.1 RnfH family protein [Photobacterium halotolerans]
MSSEQNHLIHVEVVYALPNTQRVIKLAITPDTPVQEIIERSGVLEMYPEIDLKKNKVGVFSRTVKLDATVHEGDRIEIYRPLLADPKEIRRKRAEQAKQEALAAKKAKGDTATASDTSDAKDSDTER